MERWWWWSGGGGDDDDGGAGDGGGGSSNSKIINQKHVRVFQLSNGVVLKTDLQTKFYPCKETTHSQWGQELHYLELQCKVPDGEIFVDIENQKVF